MLGWLRCSPTLAGSRVGSDRAASLRAAAQQSVVVSVPEANSPSASDMRLVAFDLGQKCSLLPNTTQEPVGWFRSPCWRRGWNYGGGGDRSSVALWARMSLQEEAFVDASIITSSTRSENAMRHIFAVVTLAVMLVAFTEAAAAQAPAAKSLEVSVAGGPSDYDLSGTGTALAVGAQLPWRPGRPFVVEPGVMFFTYSSQFETRISYLMPEVSVQVQAELKRVRPFAGVGAGAAFRISGPNETELTLHATAGMRVELSRAWGLRGELRVRSVDPWVGTTADFLFGVGRRLR